MIFFQIINKNFNLEWINNSNSTKITYKKANKCEIICLIDFNIIWNILHYKFNSSNQIIWNSKKHFLFQKTKQEQNCLIQMSLTQEGLYVVDLKTLSENQKTNLNQME